MARRIFAQPVRYAYDEDAPGLISGPGTALVLGAMCLAYVAMAFWSMAHVDLARDMHVAMEMRRGGAWPRLGPVLAGHIHLGPIWYYLLALLQSITGDWLATVLLLASLGALQFPLAYLAGKAWAGPGVGLLWAVLLFIPSWSTFEQIYPTHTQLVGATVAALAWLSARYVKGGRPHDLALAILFFSLALHAHATTVALIGVPLLLVARAMNDHRPGLSGVWLGVALASLPFAPWLFEQTLHGWPVLHEVRGYLGSDNTDQLSLGKLPALVWQASAGGLRYWLEVMLGLSPTLSWGLTGVFAGAVALGLAGVVWRGSRADRWVLLAWLASLPILVLLRDHFYFWMLTGTRVLLLGLVAVGLAHLASTRARLRNALFAFLAVGIGLYLSVVVAVARWQEAGTWPFAIMPDVTAIWAPTTPLAAMPAYAMRASGRWQCSAQPISLHGAYAVALVHDYAMEAALACREVDIVVGGADPARRHWLGLSRAMARQVGADATRGIGPFVLLPARRVLDGGEAISLHYPGQAPFPPLSAREDIESTRVIELALRAGERLAISHLGIGFVEPPNVRIWAAGRALSPVAADMTASVYACASCGDTTWRVEIRAPRPGLLDAVVF